MGFNSNATVASAPSSGTWVKMTGAAKYRLPGTYSSGVYRVKAYSANLDGAISATVNFLSSSGSVVATGSFVDTDTGNNANATEVILKVTSASTDVEIIFSSQTTFWLQVEQLFSSIKSYSANTLTSYTSTQNVTITSSTNTVLLFGGGGAAGCVNSWAYGSGGGGSGFVASTANMTAGTYPLVIGAGGIGSSALIGANGGTSTFNGLSAAGGNGGNNLKGGSGGSGGGVAGSNGGTYNRGGGNGASDGANSQPSSSTGEPAALGSGVSISQFGLSSTGGYGGSEGGTQGSPGQGGGLYGGGGAGGGAGGSGPVGLAGYSAGANTAGGGGGAGAGSGSAAGGSGGSGVLYVLSWTTGA